MIWSCFHVFSHPIASFCTTFDILPIRLVNSDMTTATFAEKKEFYTLERVLRDFCGYFSIDSAFLTLTWTLFLVRHLMRGLCPVAMHL